MELSIFSITESLIILLVLFLLFKVGFNKSVNPREKVAFSAFIISVLGWMIPIWLTNSVFAKNEQGLLLIARFGWSFPLLILSTLLYFYLTKFSAAVRYRYLSIVLLFLGAVMWGLSIFTSFVVKGVDLIGVRAVFGNGYYAILFLVLLTVIFLHYVRSKIEITASPVNKMRMRFLSIGFNTSILLAFITNIILPLMLGSSRYSHVAIIALVPTVIVCYYALVYNRFYDIDLLKINAIRYLFFNTITSIIILGLLVIGNANRIDLELIFLMQVLLFLLYIATRSDIFSLAKYNKSNGFYRLSLNTFSRLDTLRIQFLLDAFATYICDAYKISKVHIQVCIGTKHEHYEHGSSYPEEQLFCKRVLIDDIAENYLEVCVYNKKSGLDFSVQELHNLDKDTLELERLILQSILYEDSIRFNETLQKKIDKATRRLRKQKEELQQKYQAEKDMMGILGHELRTPITVAKGMLELVLEKMNKQNIEPMYVTDKLQKIYSSILKESELIQTMLSTAHVDNKKMNLQISDTDLIEIVDYTVHAYTSDAEKKGLKLLYNRPSFELPILKSDPSRLQEIVTNLVSNAIKYTHKGTVEISIELKSDAVLLHVKDTGIGIPEHELINVGKKFYRINQYLDERKQVVRAGGTGLGLYVVKGILESLGGELIVTSKLNEGSVFTALLPLESHFQAMNSTPSSRPSLEENPEIRTMPIRRSEI